MFNTVDFTMMHMYVDVLYMQNLAGFFSSKTIYIIPLTSFELNFVQFLSRGKYMRIEDATALWPKMARFYQQIFSVKPPPHSHTNFSP